MTQEKYLHKLDLSGFAYWELRAVRNLLDAYLEGKNDKDVNWFAKKIVLSNLIPKVCLVDDDNNYYGLEGEKLVKLSAEEKKSMHWNGNEYERENTK